MSIPSDNEIREAFEHEIRQMPTFFSLQRSQNGDYRNDRTEGAWRGFVLGYTVGFIAAHDQSPAFTVTPDAQSRARDFESVNVSPDLRVGGGLKRIAGCDRSCGRSSPPTSASGAD